jgi:uncharacterized protein YggE
VEPDIAQIAAGVTTQADAARDARVRNGREMAAIIEGLKAAGIAPTQLRTTEISLDPRFTRPETGRTATIDSYEASSSVVVTVPDVQRVSELLDLMVSLGANYINGVTFDAAEVERLEDEARTRAMATAGRRAQLYARGAGAQLGPVLSITEHQGYQQEPIGMRSAYYEHGAAPVEPGRRHLKVRVHVVYALQ